MRKSLNLQKEELYSMYIVGNDFFCEEHEKARNGLTKSGFIGFSHQQEHSSFPGKWMSIGIGVQ